MPLPALAIPIIYAVAGSAAAAGAGYFASRSRKSPSRDTEEKKQNTSQRASRPDDISNEKKQVKAFIKYFYGEEKVRDFEHINVRGRLKQKVNQLAADEKPGALRDMNENLAKAKAGKAKIEKALRELDALDED